MNIPGLSSIQSAMSAMTELGSSLAGGGQPPITRGGNNTFGAGKAGGADAAGGLGGMLDQIKQALSQIPGIGPMLDQIMSVIKNALGGGSAQGSGGAPNGAQEGGGSEAQGGGGTQGAGGAQGSGNPLDKIMQALQGIPGMDPNMLSAISGVLNGVLGGKS